MVSTRGVSTRWSESLKQHVETHCPEVVVEYNKFTAGVDKHDFCSSFIPCPQKQGSEWPVRVEYPFVSFAFCNSWIKYICDASAEKLPKKEMKDIFTFQSDIARSSIASNHNGPPRRV